MLQRQRMQVISIRFYKMICSKYQRILRFSRPVTAKILSLATPKKHASVALNGMATYMLITPKAAAVCCGRKVQIACHTNKLKPLLVLSSFCPIKTCDTMLQSSAVTNIVNNPFPNGLDHRSMLADVIPPILNLPSYVLLSVKNNMSRLVGKQTMWFPNRSDTNRSVQ